MGGRDDAVAEIEDVRHLEGRRLAHDLLQSVVIIEALSGTLQAPAAADPGAAERLTQLQREVRVMAGLCDRYLQDARAPGTVDVGVVAARVVDRARVVSTAEITLELAPARVEGDELDWERAVYNVVENACRAAGEDGKVAVRAWSTEEAVWVRVGDSGPGYGHSVAGRASLGMVSVSRLVERHGGHVEVGCSSLGGAEVTLVVPISL